MYAKVYVEITNTCNMNCSFCHGHSRPPRRMTESEFSHILSSLDGVTQYIYYHLMGEPLLHPALPRFLQMAKAQGFRSILTTNGTLLKARGNEILDAGVHKVSISLHSFETGREEDFFRYLSECCDFADLASKSGTIVIFRLWNRGFDCGRNEQILGFLQKRLDGEWTENTRGVRIRDKLHIEWGERFAWPDKDAPKTGDTVFCYGLSDHFAVLADGTVGPCCMASDGVIALGNAFETPITEILMSPRAQAMKKGFACRRASEELCRKCGYARRFK